MAVLLYQIGIFIAIFIASFFGKNSRNTAVVLISIFTLLQVFTSWLLILQFITIFVAYVATEKDESTTKTKIENKEYEPSIVYKTIKKTEEIKEATNRGFEIGCGFFGVILALFATIALIYRLATNPENINSAQIILTVIFGFFGVIGWFSMKSDK